MSWQKRWGLRNANVIFIACYFPAEHLSKNINSCWYNNIFRLNISSQMISKTNAKALNCSHLHALLWSKTCIQDYQGQRTILARHTLVCNTTQTIIIVCWITRVAVQLEVCGLPTNVVIIEPSMLACHFPLYHLPYSREKYVNNRATSHLTI